VRSVSRVTILGTIGAGKSVAVVSPFDGTVRERRAELGERVAAGDILVMMDGGEAESRFREAQSGLLKASMALDVLNRWDNSADVMRARRTLESTEATLSTYERQVIETKALLDRGIVSRNEYDGLVQQRDTQRVGAASARQDLQTTMERGNANNRQLAELDLANARARLSDLKQQVDGTMVRAPVAGILTRPPASGSASLQTPTVMDPGVRLTRGQSIFAIADTQTLIVTGKADEVDVNQLRIGQPVTIASDAFPGDPIIGRVVSVSAEADSSIGGAARAPSFEVRAAFTGQSDEQRRIIRLGMSARMTIETRSNSSAIVIPVEAVRDATTAPVVRMRDPKTGEERDQPVVLGSTSESGIEIVKGLDAGATIIMPQNSRF
jgi:RND family efflux transporter MFP subunit